jgi:hypothetical protein
MKAFRRARSPPPFSAHLTHDNALFHAVIRWVSRKGAPEGSWLQRMMARKPRMLVAVALANKMARTAWAILMKNENYRVPATTAA